MCVELDAVAVEVRTMVQQFSTPPPPMCCVCTQSAMIVELSAPYCAALGEMVAHYVVCTTQIKQVSSPSPVVGSPAILCLPIMMTMNEDEGKIE